MVSMTLLFAVAVLKTLPSLMSQAPQWQRDIDKWIENDKKSFLEFKKNVFKTIRDSKHVLGTDGYERL